MGCNCNCGAPDPDCEPGVLPPQELYGCDIGQVCEEGICVTRPPTQPTPLPVFPGVPPEWNCNQLFYGDFDYCDCDCGAPDPDCQYVPDRVLNCDDGETCVDGVCVLPGTGSPTLMPAVVETSFPTGSPSEGIAETPAPTRALKPTGSPTKQGSSAPSGGLEFDLEVLLIILMVLTVVLAVIVVVLVYLSKKRRHLEVGKTPVTLQDCLSQHQIEQT